MIKCAIFDLDGTLVNSIDDLGLATDYVLKQYGKEPKWTTDDYRLFVGNGAKTQSERMLTRMGQKNLLKERLNTSFHLLNLKKHMKCLKKNTTRFCLTTPICMTELRNSLIF